jgi:hypothetical protein
MGKEKKEEVLYSFGNVIPLLPHPPSALAEKKKKKNFGLGAKLERGGFLWYGVRI